MRKILHACLLSSAILSSGCHEHEEGEDPDAEACEHLDAGPAMAVSASADPTTAGAVMPAHARWDVTLVDVAGGKGGKLRFSSPRAAEFAFYVNADTALKAANPSGVEALPESNVQSVPTCALVKRKVVIPMMVGQYILDLGPTPAASVGLVIEELAPHTH